MGDFLRVLLDSIAYLWPFKIIHQYQVGGMYLFGKFRRVLEPGLYFAVPFFQHIIDVGAVPYMVVTPRMDLTLRDGRALSVVASAWVRVSDFNLAINTVDSFHSTTTEIIKAVVADRLARVQPSRLEPESRADLLRDLTSWVAQEAGEYGISVEKVRFSTFVLGARTYRLLGDAGER
jgi:regulator of protease activity HflC (stomatin/prohibitin superfamily)